MAKRAFIGDLRPDVTGQSVGYILESIFVMDDNDDAVSFDGGQSFFCNLTIPAFYTSTTTDIIDFVESSIKTQWSDNNIDMYWLNDFAYNITDSVAAPSRSLNTAFQVHARKGAHCSYTVDTTAVLGALSAYVEVFTGPTSSPTTSQGQVGVVIGSLLGLTNTVRHQINCFVPPGHYVKLISSGAGTSTLVKSCEIVF